MKNPACNVLCFSRKMVRNAVHDAFLNTLTIGTPFPCVPAAFQQWEPRWHAFPLVSCGKITLRRKLGVLYYCKGNLFCFVVYILTTNGVAENSTFDPRASAEQLDHDLLTIRVSRHKLYSRKSSLQLYFRRDSKTFLFCILCVFFGLVFYSC